MTRPTGNYLRALDSLARYCCRYRSLPTVATLLGTPGQQTEGSARAESLFLQPVNPFHTVTRQPGAASRSHAIETAASRRSLFQHLSGALHKCAHRSSGPSPDSCRSTPVPWSFARTDCAVAAPHLTQLNKEQSFLRSSHMISRSHALLSLCHDLEL